MSPFVILVLIDVFQVDPSRWFLGSQEHPSALVDAADDDVGGGLFRSYERDGVLWRPLLNNLFWNLNSFDSAASFSADIEDPGTILPTAMVGPS